MTEQEITFSEIRQGDTIQVEHTHQDLGVLFTGIAFVTDPYTGDWLTTAGHTITTRSRPQTYTLLDRPKPALPTETKSVIFISKVRDGYGDFEFPNQLAFLDGDGEWAIFAVGGTEYVRPTDILEWNFVTITHKEA